MHIIGVYAPEDCKTNEEKEQFYKELQKTINSFQNKDPVIILGDFNARIGNNIIPGTKQRFNEDVSKWTLDSGDRLIYRVFLYK